jgi:DNA adenine methylase
MLDKVDGNRIAGDNNKYLIALWKGLQEDLERPYKIEKPFYDHCRDIFNGKKTDPQITDFILGWVGFLASFNGRFFEGGYSKEVGGRDYIREKINNIEKQIPKIKNVDFYNCDYFELEIPDKSIIYCDIPYKDTKQYSTSKNFNHKDFYIWVESMVDLGHKVFISEYQAPDDYISIWEKEVTNSLHTTNTHKPTEKLFVHKKQKNDLITINKKVALF